MTPRLSRRGALFGGLAMPAAPAVTLPPLSTAEDRLAQCLIELHHAEGQFSALPDDPPPGIAEPILARMDRYFNEACGIRDEMKTAVQSNVDIQGCKVEQWTEQLRWIVSHPDNENSETLDAMKAAGWTR